MYLARDLIYFKLLNASLCNGLQHNFTNCMCISLYAHAISYVYKMAPSRSSQEMHTLEMMKER